MSKIPLNEFITLQRGYDLPNNKRIIGKIPVVASTGIVGFHNQAKVNAPGVVIGRSGSIGGGQYITENFFPLNTTLYVKDFKGHYPRFIYYLLKNIDFETFNVGSGVPTLNRNHLSGILIKDLGIENEKRIAKILGDLDDKIHLNTQTNQTLEQIAQALYKSWFVDFEPTRAKAAVLAAGGSAADAETAAMAALSGQTPAALAALAQQNPARHQQLATLAAAFPSALVSIDGYGEVPAGWEYHKADELFDIGIGKTPPRKEKEWFSDKPSNVQWISIKDMGNAGIYITDSSEYLTKEAVDKFNIRLIPENTVIFSFKLTVGRVSITTTTTTTNEAIAHFKKREDSFLTSEYLYLFFKSFNFSRLGNTSSIATAVNSKTIRDIQILCPSKTILDGFQTYMAALFRKIKQQTLENRSLSEIRDTLLPKLLNGELPADTSFQTASEAV